jgi:pectinesterase
MILNFVMASVFFMNFSSGDVQKETPKKEAKVYDIVVSADGTADFKTIQEAFNTVAFLKKTETKIFIKNGTYKEKLEVPKDKIILL